MGRPPHIPGPIERRQVEAMAGYGIPETDIARVLQIDPKTLRKHYRDELDTGHILANAKVSESLFRKATGDGRQSVTAAIFWLKCRAGWKETAVHEVKATMTASDVKASAEKFREKIRQLAERRVADETGRLAATTLKDQPQTTNALPSLGFRAISKRWFAV